MKKNLFLLASLFLSQVACQQNMSSSVDSNTRAEYCDILKNISTQEKNDEVLGNENSLNALASHQQFIIKYREHAADAVGLSPSGRAVREYNVTGLTVRALNSSMDAIDLSMDANEREQILAEIMNDRDVEYVEPDYPIQLGDGIQEDAQNQWFHSAIGSSSAWQITLGSSDIVVAVVDSGIDYLHPDLKNNIWRNPGEVAGNGLDDDHNGYVDDIMGWNFVSDNAAPRTTNTSYHGSHVAGIIGAATTGSGINGVAQKVKMMPLKFLGEGGVGRSSDAILALQYAIDKKVFAINNSWGSSNYSKALDDTIAQAEKAGILMIVSAGNNSKNNDTSNWYPASYDESNVISVASTNSKQKLSGFSNYGSRTVHVAAPGENILSTITGGKYKTMSGTSMAAPVVTGMAVLIKAANPQLTYREVKAVLMQTVQKVSSLSTKTIAGGIVNSFMAVSLARQLAAEGDSSSCGPLP